MKKGAVRTLQQEEGATGVTMHELVPELFFFWAEKP
jgi:hypothetical protein